MWEGEGKKINTKLIVQDDGLYLLIPDVVEENTLNGVKDLLFREGYVNIDYNKVQEGLDKHSGQLFKISDSVAKFDRDEGIVVNVSDNEMAAYLTVLPDDEDNPITAQEIEYKLRMMGVIHGIKKEEINKAANTKVIVQRIIVAEGTPQENGQDAHIKYRFNTEMSQAPITNEDGSVDFYHLNLIKCVEQGQVLAERIPPTLGKNGLTVTGTTIAAESGKDLVLKNGVNTELDPSKNKLIAKSGGHAYLKNDTVNIENIYVVKGDVDFSTGNIQFLGDVIIQGDVRTGFEVHAGGNIKIKGSVEGAKIESRHGSILINESVQGVNRAELFAEEDIKAKFACNCKMKANHNVEIAKYIAHSVVEAGEDILVTQGKGAIFGGKAKAGGRIAVVNLGNESGTKTEAIIEDFLTNELRARLAVIGDKIPETEKELELAVNAKKELDRLGANVNKISSDHRTKLFDRAGKIQELTEAFNGYIAEKKEVQIKLKPREKSGCIEVKSYVYPNVTIYFESTMFEVNEKKSRICFFSEAGSIKRRDL